MGIALSFSLVGTFASYTCGHTSQGRRAIRGHLTSPFRDGFETSDPHLRLVWGRVVPDIPAFCRELVAALAEQ
jgi:hypothetical protein